MGIIFLVFVGWMFRTALNLVRKVSAEDRPLAQATDLTRESYKEEESWQ